MTTLDGGETQQAAGLYGRWQQRWQYPRLLALLIVLAFASSVNAALNGGPLNGGPLNGELLNEGAWKSTALFGAGTETLGAFGTAGANWQQTKTCARIHQIVETACGLKQYDHDPEGIRQCMAYELKYTMWSAYGCR
jgi:hypothetical protein